MSKEIDKYLTDVLSTVKNQLKEYSIYIEENKQNPLYAAQDYKDILDDYSQDIKHLEKIQPECRSISAMCDLNEDDIDFVYQCLAMYEANFVFDPEGSDKYEEQKEEYGKLSFILDMFSFDEDEDDDDEEFDEEDEDNLEDDEDNE